MAEFSYDEVVGGKPVAPAEKTFSYDEVANPKASASGQPNHDGVMANNGDEGWVSGALKGAGTAVVKGLGDIPGTLGNMADLGVYGAGRAVSAITGRPIEDIMAEAEAGKATAKKWYQDHLGFTPPQFNNGEHYSDPVLEKTGEYKPDSIYGRLGMAGTQAAVGSLGGGPNPLRAGESLLLNAAKQGAPVVAGGMIGQGVTEATGDPLLAMVAGAAVPAAAGKVAESGLGALKDKTRILRPGEHQDIAAERLHGMADNPDQALADLHFQQRDIVPGSAPTTGQVTLDKGLVRGQKAAELTDPAFANRLEDQLGAQNVARGEHVEDMAPRTADAMSPGQHLAQQLTDLENTSQAQVDRLAQGRDQLQGAIPDAVPAEDSGGRLRGVLQSAADAARARRSALYKAVDPEGNLSVVTTGPRDAARQLSAQIDPSVSMPSGFSAPVIGLTANIPDVMPFRKLMDLDETITAQMRSARRQGDYTGAEHLRVLKSAVQDAISNAVDNQHAWEQAKVSTGQLHPDATVESRIRNIGEESDLSHSQRDAGGNAGARAVGDPASEASGLFGEGLDSGQGGGGLRNSARPAGVPGGVAQAPAHDLNNYPIFYPHGRINARYEVADLPSLITSHDANFTPRRDYPQNLQPRDRSSAPAQDQVNVMASRLEPQRLGPSPEANSGAPIVGPDNIVESGNGRTLALAKAYQSGRAGPYRQWLESQGFKTDGMQSPVLVARRTTNLDPVERQRFTDSANSSGGLRMSATEQAASDAKAITDLNARIAPGPLTSVENRDFVRAFAQRLPVNERGVLLNADGNLSPSGVRRIEAALTHRAYDDPAFMSRSFEATDNNIRNLSGALTDAAGPWGDMRQSIGRGEISPEHDITKQIVDAVHKVMRARDEGQPIGALLNQQDMFGSPVSDVVRQMLMPDGNSVASRQKIAGALRTYAEEAQKNLAGERLFGEPLSPLDILKTSMQKAAPYELPPEPAPVSAALKAPEELAPNFDPDAAGRLSAAKQAHAEYAQTYRDGPVGGILKDTGFSGQYRTPDSAVPAKAFVRGDKGYETAQAHLAASNGDPAAVTAMRDMAVTRLREAMGDGPLTEATLARWRQQHDGALRALDEVSPGFSNRFNNAARAQSIVDEATATRAQALKDAQSGAAGKLIGAEHPDEVRMTVGRVMTAADGPTQMSALVARVRGNADALAGLQRAGVEWIMDKVSNAGTSGGQPVVSKAKIAPLVDQHAGALEALYGPEGVANMRRVAADLDRAQQAIDLVRARNGSDTTKLQELVKMFGDPNKAHSDSTLTWMVAVGEGFQHGGVRGAGAATLGLLVKKLYGNRKMAGEDAVNAIVKEGLLNPDVGRALLQRAVDKNGRLSKQAVSRLSTALDRAAVVPQAMQQPADEAEPLTIHRYADGGAVHHDEEQFMRDIIDQVAQRVRGGAPMNGLAALRR